MPNDESCINKISNLKYIFYNRSYLAFIILIPFTYNTVNEIDDASAEICGVVDCSYWGGRVAYNELKSDIANRQYDDRVCGGYLCIELGLTKAEWLANSLNSDNSECGDRLCKYYPGGYAQFQIDQARNLERNKQFWRDAELRCGKDSYNYDGTCNSGPVSDTLQPGTGDTEPTNGGSTGTVSSTTGGKSSPTPVMGGCLIATAALGTEMERDVQNLREIRQRMYDGTGGKLMTGINAGYYSFSPYMADIQRQNPAVNHAVQNLISPMLWSFSLINPAGVQNDEYLMAQLGLVFILNIGMYVGIPASVLMTACRYVAIFALMRRYAKKSIINPLVRGVS